MTDFASTETIKEKNKKEWIEKKKKNCKEFGEQDRETREIDYRREKLKDL